MGFYSGNRQGGCNFIRRMSKFCPYIEALAHAAIIAPVSISKISGVNRKDNVALQIM
jgi:hypothetical protein